MDQRGQSLIEVLIAIVIFGAIAGGVAVMAAGSLKQIQQGGDQTKAEALAQEGIEAVRSIKDRAWNKNIFSQSAVTISGSAWDFLGESTTETIGKFTRTIDFADVCRDSSDDLTSCPGSFTDVHSKEVTVVVTWTTTLGKTNSVQRIAFLTNWDSNEIREDVTSEWNDGIFNATEENPTLGDADGSVTLEQL